MVDGMDRELEGQGAHEPHHEQGGQAPGRPSDQPRDQGERQRRQGRHRNRRGEAIRTVPVSAGLMGLDTAGSEDEKTDGEPRGRATPNRPASIHAGPTGHLTFPDDSQGTVTALIFTR